MVQKGTRDTEESRSFLLKSQILKLIDDYHNLPEVKEFYRYVKSEKVEWRQQKALDFLFASDIFLEKLAHIAVLAGLVAEMQTGLFKKHENQLEVINEAIDLLNDLNGAT